MLYYIISYPVRIYEIIVILRVLFSWLRIDERNIISLWVYRLTEPVLMPLRNILPLNAKIDISPLILLFLLSVVQRIILMLFF